MNTPLETLLILKQKNKCLMSQNMYLPTQGIERRKHHEESIVSNNASLKRRWACNLCSINVFLVHNAFFVILPSLHFAKPLMLFILKDFDN